MSEEVYHDCPNMPLEIEIEYVDDGIESYWRMKIGDWSYESVQQTTYVFGFTHCPWCGKSPAILWPNGIRRSIGCINENCPVQPSSEYVFDTEAEAISAWNTRAERTTGLEYHGGIFTCKNCGAMVGEYEDTGRYLYCPNCGAKVREQ